MTADPHMKLTDNFQLWEFACHDQHSTPVPVELHGNLCRLCRTLELIRALNHGRSISVISGWRSVAHNLAVGGKPHSAHLTAEAADIRCGLPADLHKFILTEYKAGSLPELGGLGVYPGWVHVDVRRPSDGHLRRWVGTGVGSEQTA